VTPERVDTLAHVASQAFDFLTGKVIEQIEFSGPIRLVCARASEPSTYVEFFEAKLAQDAAPEIEFDGFEGRTRAGTVLRLLWQRVATAQADDGVLGICFESGDRLTAPPHAEFESWSLGGPDGTFQCLAGGEVVSYGR
jgi:hypothetical protein